MLQSAAYLLIRAFTVDSVQEGQLPGHDPDISPVHPPTPTSGASASASAGPISAEESKFINFSTSGGTGERIFKGFLVGLAFGVLLSAVACCWIPCLSPRRRARRARRARRIAMEDVEISEEEPRSEMEEAHWDVEQSRRHSHRVNVW